MHKFLHSKYFYAGIAPLTITIGALFLFWPILSGKVFFTGDFWGLYYPTYFSAMKFFIYNLHMLPNWWPAYDSGFPMHLASSGFLNPIFILALKFLSPFLANNIMIFIFFVLNGLSLYALCRALQLSRAGSLVAAISYAFSGIVLRAAGNAGEAAGLIFLPLSFLCCLKIFEGKKKWFWLWLTLLVYSWIGGWVELHIYSLVAVGFFVIYLLIKNRKSENFDYRRLILFFGAVALSVIILLPWFLPVLYFIGFSGRAGGIPEAVAGGPMLVSDFIQMLHPRLSITYGDFLPFIPFTYPGYLLYMGTLPLILILASFFIKDKKEKGYFLFFLLLAAGSVLMITSQSFYSLFHQIPVLNWFQIPAKWSFFFVFSLAILAGYGIDNIKNFFQNRFSGRIIVFFWLLMLIVITSLILTTIFGGRIQSLFNSYGISHYKNISNRVFLRADAHYEDIIRKISASIVYNFSFKNKWTILMAVLWLLALIHVTIGKYEFMSSLKWKVAAVLITLFGSTLPWVGLPNGPPVSHLKNEPESAKYLHSIEPYQGNKLPLTAETSKLMEPYRIYTYEPPAYRAFLAERYKVDLSKVDLSQEEAGNSLTKEIMHMEDNLSLIFNFDTFMNKEPLALQRLTDLYLLTRQQKQFTKEGPTDTTSFNEHIKAFSEERNFRLLGMLNIKYILTPVNLGNKWKPVFTTYVTDGKIPIYIYQNPYFLPRWYFADKIRWTKAENKTAFEDLQKIGNFGKMTLLETTNLNNPALLYASSPNDKIEMELYTAGKLILKTKTQNYRFLIFSESKFPDFWQASVNGEKVPIYTANYLYQAVLVPPGENTVEFRYPKLWEQSLFYAQYYIANFLNKIK